MVQALSYVRQRVPSDKMNLNSHCLQRTKSTLPVNSKELNNSSHCSCQGQNSSFSADAMQLEWKRTRPIEDQIESVAPIEYLERASSLTEECANP